ncbi:stalk domain-containing protein [Paenibacillus taiwanensis]|uniref:stalk domain-containing protein n=1 Tax=Paenibacillus taiwanensis TaxID=401638 RepID=UPI000411C617|nr:stalk domain-containing protein [Paenibacillus taiwanensis]
MKVLKCIHVMIISTLVLCAATVAYASNAETVVLKKAPVHLQINEYNVLFTDPKPPYVDNNNRLMIPLRAISELLGAKVSYSSTDKKASIQMGENKLSITAGAKEININGPTKRMDTVPVVYKQSLFVPLRILIDHFHLPVTRFSTTGIVNIESKSLLEWDMMQAVKESDITPEISNLNAFAPLHYDLKINTEKGKLQEGEIKITSKNISKHNITQGKEDMHVIFLYNNGFEMEIDRDTTDHVSNRVRPAFKVDEVFERKLTFDAPNYTEKLKYILAVGRTFK